MELFAEGSRSRSGKLQKSKNTILDLIAKAQVQGKLTATKVIVVPIHIVYERVVESEQFALALLGEASDRPTLRSLLKSMPFLK
jgi:glycerol-3-phosphate O-acyltransferase